VESHLDRFVSPRLGRNFVGDVKRGDIATLADDIVEGRFGKPSRSNARHMCMAVSGMFKFAIKKEFISSNPAILLGEWTNTKKHGKPKKRNLKPIEIKQFWHGLDREDLPHDRRTRLAMKFELVAMLRGHEFTPMLKADVHDLDGAHPYITVPVERVKNRRHELKHPLSPLAVEIIREALKDNPTDYVFATVQRGGRLINKPLGRQTTSNALRDRKDKKNLNPGLCTLLGMTKFTPHDLRRTAATILRAIANPKTNGITMAKISICLDHTVKREEGAGAAVTMEHYVDAEEPELAEKREVLELLAKELRHIIGLPPKSKAIIRQLTNSISHPDMFATAIAGC
jgi:integrase